ncbi:hypothetical protein BDN72DRAFT_956168 [Pluteus cervinus]|uniref:Uncharacterized protein n=1 Tax=Pluteus cervinus TaxID=181527 RepID=A0ACD3B683_9AGAR|nr:hypothetical protein BDN72DRAFT_956168 [Pluteus cervinus]
MAIDDHHVLPVLPPELQFIIFQVALENNMIDAQNLLFVARHVFDWLIPILYKVVLLSPRNLYAWPLLPLPITKLPQYGRHVHRLLLLSPPDHILDQYLQHCPNIVDFSSFSELPDPQFDLVLRLPLHHLCTTFIARKQYLNPLAPSVFSKLTHITTNGEQIGLVSHCHFPSLTHLAIGDRSYSVREVPRIFEQNPGLRVLIVGYGTQKDITLPEVRPYATPGVNDARVVHLEYNVIINWRTRNIWSFAEGIVEERLALADTQHSG